MPDSQQGEWDQRYRKRKDKFTRLVAEGDSWFAYPVWNNIVDYVDTETKQYAIRRLGESGRRLNEIVNDGNYLKAVQEENPKALLISGSGNDFINKEFVTGGDGGQPLLNKYKPGSPAEDLVNKTKWRGKLNEITGLFETLISRVDGAAPILVHGYDYIIPSPEGAKYDGKVVAGPWIQPTMHTQGIDDADLQRAIGKYMIDSINDLLTKIALDHPKKFYHVSLLGTLPDGDWANEIHPYGRGFKKLAVRMSAAISLVLSGNVAPPVIT